MLIRETTVKNRNVFSVIHN